MAGVVSTVTSRTSRAAIAGIALSFVLAIGVGVLRWANAEPAERSFELAGNVAFAIVLATPALLGLLAIRGRPTLFVAAGVLSVACVVVGAFSIGLLFVPQAVLFFVAARGDAAPRSRGAVSAAVIAVVLGVMAFVALFAHDDPVCWARIGSTGRIVRVDAERFVRPRSISMDSADLPPGTTESGCTSDTISAPEAATAVALVAAMVLGSWFVGRPSSTDPFPAPG